MKRHHYWLAGGVAAICLLALAFAAHAQSTPDLIPGIGKEAKTP